ncbi:MAG: EAL domain-containing protein, partial [Brevundimonas sp.]|nr:EAL domain-containing protein [Brevundimonas sp.]
TGLPESTENRTIVQSIISLGKGLGMPVTAEGVETAEVLAALPEFQGLKAQGYLYGYPSPAEATLAELKQMNLAADVAPAADTSATAQAASL